MFKFIKKWLIRRNLAKAASENTELAEQLNQELTWSHKEYAKVLREAKARNQLLEAQRRIENLKRENSVEEEDEEEEDEEEDLSIEQEAEKLLSNLVQNAMKKRALGQSSDPDLDQEILSPTKIDAMEKIKNLPDEAIEKFTKKYF